CRSKNKKAHCSAPFLFKRESLGAIYGLDHASPARILVSTQLAQCFSDPTLAVASDSTAIAHDQSAALSLSAMTSHFMESLPFSSPDEFPTPRNLSAYFSGLNDRQAHGQYHKT